MLKIRPVQSADAAPLARIYNYYIENTHHTFETEPLTVTEMRQRIEAISPAYPFIVAAFDDVIAGYAYASSYKTRPAYRFAVESSIYIALDCCGKNIGVKLYRQLIREIFQTGKHTVIAGIALPNDASIKLHEKLGFIKTAHFREVGFKLNRRIDVGYWQLFNPPAN